MIEDKIVNVLMDIRSILSDINRKLNNLNIDYKKPDIDLINDLATKKQCNFANLISEKLSLIERFKFGESLKIDVSKFIDKNIDSYNNLVNKGNKYESEN